MTTEITAQNASGEAFPRLHASACDHCRRPCAALAGNPGRSAILASGREVPGNCPLRVPRGRLSARHLSDFRGCSLQNVLLLAGGGFPPAPVANPRPDASVLEAIRTLHAQDRLAVLFAPFHSEARNALDAWRGSRLSGAILREKEREEAEAAEAAKEAEKPHLMNPVWLGKQPQPDSTEENPAITKASAGAAVWCRVEAGGLSVGDSIMFTVCPAGKKDKLEVLSGRIESRKDEYWASARFAISPKIIPPGEENVKLEFFARQFAHKLEAKGPVLTVGPVTFEILLQLDTDDPKAKDDELILVDDKGGEVTRVKVSEMKEESENHVRLKFRNIEMGAKYSLVRDHGPDEEGGQDSLWVNLSPDEIMAMFQGDEEEGEDDGE